MDQVETSAGLHARVRQRYAAVARSYLDGIEAQRLQALESGNAFGPACYGRSERTQVPTVALRASLGCGNPIASADLRPGQRVLDLGCGAGMDAILAALEVGATGAVIGLDLTTEMLAIAALAVAGTQISTVSLLLGAMENVPLAGESIDVVISNGVVHFAADKQHVMDEMFRVLVPGGNLAIADLISDQRFDPKASAGWQHETGWTTGPTAAEDYRYILHRAGFVDPAVTLGRAAAPGIYSGIVTAAKPPRSDRRGAERRRAAP